MTYEGSDVVCIRTTIGAAAGLVVEETETRGPTFRKHRPFPSEMPQEVRRGSPRAAIVSRHDGFPSETENAFTDDHVLV
jgi:hypothetical protein